ncbi:MAG: chemotaxis protein CheW [Methanomicrobiales archaeon]|nr:chemotaxis protein CheW [Methanomicrobiales archaeon]
MTSPELPPAIEERAKIFRKVLESPLEGEGDRSLNIVIFSVQDTAFVFDARTVETFMKYSESIRAQLIQVYDAPAFLLGCIKEGDEITLIIDTRMLFGYPRSTAEGQTLIMMKGRDSEGAAWGLVVDVVTDIYQIARGDVLPYTMPLASAAHQVVTGVLSRRTGSVEVTGGDEGRSDMRLLMVDFSRIHDLLIRGGVREPVKGFYYWRSR